MAGGAFEVLSVGGPAFAVAALAGALLAVVCIAAVAYGRAAGAHATPSRAKAKGEAKVDGKRKAQAKADTKAKAKAQGKPQGWAEDGAEAGAQSEAAAPLLAASSPVVSRGVEDTAGKVKKKKKKRKDEEDEEEEECLDARGAPLLEAPVAAAIARDSEEAAAVVDGWTEVLKRRGLAAGGEVVELDAEAQRRAEKVLSLRRRKAKIGEQLRKLEEGLGANSSGGNWEEQERAALEARAQMLEDMERVNACIAHLQVPQERGSTEAKGSEDDPWNVEVADGAGADHDASWGGSGNGWGAHGGEGQDSRGDRSWSSSWGGDVGGEGIAATADWHAASLEPWRRPAFGEEGSSWWRGMEGCADDWAGGSWGGAHAASWGGKGKGTWSRQRQWEGGPLGKKAGIGGKRGKAGKGSKGGFKAEEGALEDDWGEDDEAEEAYASGAVGARSGYGCHGKRWQPVSRSDRGEENGQGTSRPCGAGEDASARAPGAPGAGGEAASANAGGRHASSSDAGRRPQAEHSKPSSASWPAPEARPNWGDAESSEEERPVPSNDGCRSGPRRGRGGRSVEDRERQRRPISNGDG